MFYMIIFIVLMILSFVVSRTLNARIEKYSKIRLSSGLTGKEIAEKMLQLEEDDTLYKEQEEIGIQRAKLFSWKQTAEQLLDVYHAIQNQKS